MELPFQPTKDGRFVPNRIVELLLETSTHDMNSLAFEDFTREECVQFAQLIGYSVGGFCGLSYVSEEDAEAACALTAGIPPDEARRQALRIQLEGVRRYAKHITDLLG